MHIFSLLCYQTTFWEWYSRLYSHRHSPSFSTLSPPSYIAARTPSGSEDKWVLKAMSFLSVCPFKKTTQRGSTGRYYVFQVQLVVVENLESKKTRTLAIWDSSFLKNYFYCSEPSLSVQMEKGCSDKEKGTLHFFMKVKFSYYV